MNELFSFKEFIIDQYRCAMKVGTDGVLLGAWSSLQGNTNAILDIGTGTGIIALMLAQRSDAQIIDAVEIDDDAYEQAVENFERSNWADRLFCYHASLGEFISEVEECYDLIICNPPFFSENVSSGNDSRDMARQNASLPFDELLDGVSKLLSYKGTFATIIPFKEENDFVKEAVSKGLFPKRITRVRGKPSSQIKRSLLEFGRKDKEAKTDELVIEKERHRYTDAYVALTRDFYLKM